MEPDRIYRATAPPLPGAYYNVNDLPIPPPATYKRPGRRGCNPCSCLLWFLAIMALLLLMALTVLIFALVVKPEYPQFHVENIRVTLLTGVTTGTSSNTTIAYAIMAYNPNKRMSFYYSDINVKVEARVEESSNTIGERPGERTVASFSQGHRNTTYVNVEIENVTIPSNTYLTNVPLYAELNLKVKLKVGAVKTGKIKMKVKCKAHVDLTVTTRSQHKNSSCEVHW